MQKDSARIIPRLIAGSYINMTVSILVSTAAGAIDGIFIGSCLGVDAMAAFGLVSPLTFLILMVPSIFGTGLQTVYGMTIGKGDIEQANRYFNITIAALAAVTIVLIALIFFFLEPFAALLGASGSAASLNPLVCAYIIGILPGMLFNFLNTVISSMLFLKGDRTRAVLGAVAVSASDIIGDILNVFVFSGGLLGMGLATSASWIIGFFVMGSYFVGERSDIRLSLKGLSLRDLSKVLYYGITKFFEHFSLLLYTLVINKLIVAFGTAADLATFAIVSNFTSIVFSANSGLGAATLMLTSVFAGEEDKVACRSTFHYACVIGIISNVVLAALIAILAGPIARLYTADAQVAAAAALALRLALLCVPFASLTAVIKNFYQPTGRLLLARVILVLQYCICRVAPAIILATTVGICGAFWSFYVICEVMTLVVIAVIIRMKTGRFPTKIDDFMFLEEGFGSAPGSHLELIAHDRDDVLSIKDIAYDFCIVRNNDHHAAPRLALFIEEMCMNIIRYGFVDGRSDPEIHIRMLYHDEGYILRIRDNGRQFDPVEWMEIHREDADDPTRNIGIRMVSAMAKEITYTRTLDLNNLIIHV